MGERKQLLQNAWLYSAIIILMRLGTILERLELRIIIADTLALNFLSFRPILERQFLRSIFSPHFVFLSGKP